MKYFASPSFWDCYGKLPFSIRELSDKNFKLLKENPRHPSLHLKKVSNYWSVRIGIKYRALAIQQDEKLLWFWIGSHSQYNAFVSKP